MKLYWSYVSNRVGTASLRSCVGVVLLKMASASFRSFRRKYTSTGFHRKSCVVEVAQMDYVGPGLL